MLSPSLSKPLVPLDREFLLRGVELSKPNGLPVIHAINLLPKKIIPFSTAMQSEWKDFDCWVCFYERDSGFERLWNHPMNYLERLKRFQGIISPDYSLSIYDDPITQFRQIFRGRVLAAWMEVNGIPVIANVRYANLESLPFCCEGIPCGNVFSVGTLGCLQKKEFWLAVKEGVDYSVGLLNPQTIVVYGGCPMQIFGRYRQQGIQILSFESQTRQRLDEAKAGRRQADFQKQDALQGRLFEWD